MKVKVSISKSQAFSLHKRRLWFTVSNTFERSVIIAPILLLLFSIEHRISIAFRRACWVLCFLWKLAYIFWIDLSKTQFLNYFWKIRKGSNRSMVTFVCRITTSPHLKTEVISVYFRISGKFPLFTVYEIFYIRWNHNDGTAIGFHGSI